MVHACSQIKQKTSGFKSPVDLSLLGLKQKGLYLHGLPLPGSTLSTKLWYVFLLQV